MTTKQQEYTGKTVRAVQQGGWTYKGRVLDNSEEWLVVEKLNGQTVELRKDALIVLEVLE